MRTPSTLEEYSMILTTSLHDMNKKIGFISRISVDSNFLLLINNNLSDFFFQTEIILLDAFGEMGSMEECYK